MWGGHLEKRIGSAYFVLLYVVALIGGSIASNLIHTNQYLGVGASGAISGVLGALLCLRILGKLDLPLNFFAINIGLNIALAFTARNIDWAAHAGGFAVGLVACAGLDVVEKANAYLLRCKFPEFAKLNLLLLTGGCLFLVCGSRAMPCLPGLPDGCHCSCVRSSALSRSSCSTSSCRGARAWPSRSSVCRSRTGCCCWL